MCDLRIRCLGLVGIFCDGARVFSGSPQGAQRWLAEFGLQDDHAAKLFVEVSTASWLLIDDGSLLGVRNFPELIVVLCLTNTDVKADLIAWFVRHAMVCRRCYRDFLTLADRMKEMEDRHV